MNILNKLTIKHLKMNKKRTLVTIIGIVLSTSLMVGIGLLMSSFLYSEKLDAIENNGSYHTYIEDLNEEEIKKINANINVDKTYYYAPIGFAKTKSNISTKPYLYVVEANNDFLNKIKISEGRLPHNSNEIIVKNGTYCGEELCEIGSNITLEIGSRYVEEEELEITRNYPLATTWKEEEQQVIEEEIKVKQTQTYKVVGFIKNMIYDTNGAGFMALTYKEIPSAARNVYIEFKKPGKTYELTKEIINNLALEGKTTNSNARLLYFYGATEYDNINNTMVPIIIIALSVISIGCIIVIYNSFAISTMERKKSFGLYSSIGATMKQIKHTVLFEAAVVGIIGIILGILGAFLGIYVVIQILNYLISDFMSMQILFHADLLYLIIPLIFMVIVILISAYLPAKRSSKVTPIEAIRGNDDIKISKKEVKTPKFIRHLFGIEGDIAFKNIKRNKKKYRITIISLFISIVMFNTFTSFLAYFVKTSDSFDSYDYDISLSLHGEAREAQESVDYIRSKYEIDEYLFIKNGDMYSEMYLKEEDFTPDYKELVLEKTDHETGTPFRLLVLENEVYSKLTTSEAILLNNKYITIYQEANRKTKDIEVFNKKSYQLKLQKEGQNMELDAVVWQKSIPFGLKTYLYEEEPIVIISLNTYQEKFPKTTNYFGTFLLNSKDYKKIYNDIDNDKIKLSTTTYIHSPKIDMAATKNVILAVKILFYGFISLIVLIGVTSVINTINTNINLRRKEFAMLRSIGLTPKGFNKLLFFESLFFGLKSLIYGIPVSMGINLLISKSLQSVIETSAIIPWDSIIYSIIGVFLIVILSMNYASKKIKKENILEALREENI